MSRKRSYTRGFKSTASLLSSQIRQVGEGRGFAVSRLLTHLDNDHETEDFVRVEGGEYSSHFIVNEEDFAKSIMWISDQLHFNDGYFYRECCRR